MTKNYHVCLDVRGALLNWTDRQMKGLLLHDDGRKMSAREARLALMDEIAKGHAVIPCSPCDNFDYSGPGCMGHDLPNSGPLGRGKSNAPPSTEEPKSNG